MATVFARIAREAGITAEDGEAFAQELERIRQSENRFQRGFVTLF